jgi:hypothetical protein
MLHQDSGAETLAPVTDFGRHCGASGIGAVRRRARSMRAPNFHRSAPCEGGLAKGHGLAPQIAWLYDLLLTAHPSPVVVEVNRVVGVAMAQSPQGGLSLLVNLKPASSSPNFTSSRRPCGPSSRLGKTAETADAYRRALSLATNDVERSFLRRRLAENR